MYYNYLAYVLRHKWYVFLECWKRGLYLRGLTHDLSKFRPSEFFPYADYFFGRRLKVDLRFNYAWLLHQHRNPHHPSYWAMNGKILPMPPKVRLEMLCDWIGAGKFRSKT